MVVLRRERDVSIIIDGTLVDVVEEGSKCQSMFRVDRGGYHVSILILINDG